ncbi:hypothetical protein K1T71_002747 [Dendrolimus kikuchii]|uniref:Uncharacterized protein n=1 Tax=Dendrolimus kikuchii TaxID=765133 RepID=A0ACC1DDU2_9NEOP|nr:hypothetical protein K1T71_002747 [Dendrolimus kikuchii]
MQERGSEGCLFDSNYIMKDIFLLQLPLLIMAFAYRYLPEEGASPQPVFGNKYVVSIKDIPYHVLVVYNNLYCSGSLVRSNIVVTAASCLSFGDLSNIMVKVGSSTITDRGEVIPVKEVKLHEYFRHLSLMDNDIAMLVLQEHVTFSKNVKKISLVDPEVSLRPGTTIDVSGWGGNNLSARFLYKLLLSEMVVIKKSECQDHYKHLLTRSNFCVKYQMDRRFSDNGGPAVFKGLLVGIVSYGGTSNSAPHITILTNISYFNRWIVKNSHDILTKNCINHVQVNNNEEPILPKDYYA